MKKASILVIAIQLSIFLMLISCSDDCPTDPPESSLIGTWHLLAMKINGDLVCPDSSVDVPVKLKLNSDGTGQIWEEDYGRPEGGLPGDLIWHTSGDRLWIQVKGEEEVGVTFTLTENMLSLLFSDGGELIYERR